MLCNSKSIKIILVENIDLVSHLLYVSIKNILEELMNKKIFFILIIIILTCSLLAKNPSGKIKGKVVDQMNKISLPGVNIKFIDLKFNAISDENGEFEISDIPVDSYTILFSMTGYASIIKTDVVVRSKRITYLNVELREDVVHVLEKVTVTPNYFHDNEKEPHSSVNFSSEEVRRSAGTGGDVSKILKLIPGAASISDQANDLIVRGGSPAENAFFVDNIEIPNINQIPQLGSSGGMFSIINSDFLQNVNFYTGGFSAAYGDRLSSIVDMTFREGNRDEFDGQLDLNMGGFGGGFEGPIAGGKGSWMLSGRKSYLDVIMKMFGKGFIPTYSDIHAKFVYDINPKQSITFLNIFGTSNLTFSKEDSIDEGRDTFGDNTTYQNTVGVNWRSIWSDKAFSNTSLSYSFIKNNNMAYNVITEITDSDLGYVENSISLRNNNYLTINNRNKIEFGLQIKNEFADYDYYYASYTDYMGNNIPEKDVNLDFSSYKYGLFFSYIWNPFDWLTTTFGLRGDYFSFNENFHLSPRFSLSWKINNKLSLNLGAGVFYQTIPMFFLSQNPEFSDLEDSMAIHYIAGLEYFLSSDTKLTLEVYDKEYSNQLIDPDYPYHFIFDQTTRGRISIHDILADTGIARSQGIELMIQKKLKNKFYGIISASYFRSEYQDYFGNWRNRTYDNRCLFSIVGGYKPNKNWEFSLNWTYIGGAPYTPLDLEKSEELNAYIIDQSRINEERYPDYNSLNLRIERRFYFSGSSLIIYIEVWNVLDNDNVYFYYWDKNKIEMGTKYQYNRLPILGIEYEF